jgi:hypothetical protein
MKRYLIYLVLTSLTLISCQKILFNDDETTRILSLEKFNAAEISGIFNIVLIQDSTNKLVIKGNNDINSIKANIKDGILVIDDPGKMSFNSDKNTIELHFSKLEYLTAFNPVNVSNEDTIRGDLFVFNAVVEVAEVNLVVDCNVFVVSSANTIGSFRLSGKADYCALYCRFGCNFFARDLSCRIAEVFNESIGDVHVTAFENLRAYIRGPGNIYYYGTPVIEIIEKRGEGKIIHLN